MRKDTTIKNKINEKGVAKAIGRNITDFFTALFEILDNSVSNLMISNDINKNIHIDILENPDESVTLVIEDNGTGIEHITSFASLGDTSHQNTSRNCHGFGLKNVINSLSILHGKVETRTNSMAQNNEYVEITKDNFKLKNATITTITNEPYPGRYETGTRVILTMEPHLFYSATNNFRGRKTFTRAADATFETIGYLLAKDINDGIRIYYSAKSNDDKLDIQNKIIQPIAYNITKDLIPQSKQKIKKDFGRGEVTAEFHAYYIEDNPYGAHAPFNNLAPSKYGRVTHNCPGAVLIINGRTMIERIPFETIYGICNHPALNHFLPIIELTAANPDAMPQTTPAKNGYVSDCVLGNICEEMKKRYKPTEKDFRDYTSAVISRWEQLKNRFDTTHTNDVNFKTEISKKIEDIILPFVIFDNDKITVFEGQKRNPTPDDVYQVLRHADTIAMLKAQDSLPADIPKNTPISYVIMHEHTLAKGTQSAIHQIQELHGIQITPQKWQMYDITY